ncbi:unnamed protein product, partial [Amoebophrya sp. A120]
PGGQKCASAAQRDQAGATTHRHAGGEIGGRPSPLRPRGTGARPPREYTVRTDSAIRRREQAAWQPDRAGGGPRSPCSRYRLLQNGRQGRGTAQRWLGTRRWVRAGSGGRCHPLQTVLAVLVESGMYLLCIDTAHTYDYEIDCVFAFLRFSTNWRLLFTQVLARANHYAQIFARATSGILQFLAFDVAGYTSGQGHVASCSALTALGRLIFPHARGAIVEHL